MAKSVKAAWKSKKDNAKRAGIPFDLTVSDYHWLLFMARITHRDIGKDKYHLARFNDAGGYTRGNCRFIWHKDNLKEINWTPERCAARSEQRKKDWTEGKYSNRVVDASSRSRDNKGRFVA